MPDLTPDFITEYFEALYTLLFDPGKRLFVGYLLTAFLLALGFLVLVKRQSISRACQNIFAKSVWLSASSRVDCKLIFANQAIMMLLSPLLISNIVIASLLFEFAHHIFQGRAYINITLPILPLSLAYTLAFFVVDDFSRFIVHYALHRYPVLWEFHKLHHSATHLTPLTVLRTHPVEGLIFSLRAVAVQALMVATTVFFFGNQIGLINILGANLFAFLFHALGSNLRHTHIQISYGPWIESVLISPAQHQIHHSIAPEHYNRNFGVALAIWDLIFKTHLYAPKNMDELSYGLLDDDAMDDLFDDSMADSRAKDMADKSLIYYYFQPFKNNYYKIRHWSRAWRNHFTPRLKMRLRTGED